MHRRFITCLITVIAAAIVAMPGVAFAEDTIANAAEDDATQIVVAPEGDAQDAFLSSDSGDAAGADVPEGQIAAEENAGQMSNDQVVDGVAVSDEEGVAEEPAAEEAADISNADAVDTESASAGDGESETVASTVEASTPEDVSAASAAESIAAATTSTASAVTVSKTPKKAAAPTVKSGWYTIKSLLNGSYAIYVKGLKTKDGTKLQLKKGVTSAGFAFKFKKVGKYYRIIVGIAKKRSVQILGVKNGTGGIVSINAKKNKSTLFKLKYNEALGGYVFVNAKTKQVLAVKGGKAKSGAKIVGAKPVADSKAQTFKLAARPGLVTTNVYSFKTVQKGKRALTANGSRASFFSYIAESDQKWYVAPVKGKKNVYTIESITNGKRLTGVKDKRVRVRAAKDSNKAQWWVPSFGGKGIVWKNYSTKKPLSTSGKKCEEGSKAMNKKYDSETSYQFKLKKRIPVESGVYMLYSGANASLNLEVAGGKKTAGATVQVNTADADLNQKWFYDASKHTFKNVNSNLALEAKTTDEGSMIVQSELNGAKTQTWNVVYAGGGKVQIVSGANKNYVLSAVGNATAAATNSQNTQAKTQKWKVVETTADLQPKGFKLVKSIVNYGHGPLKATYIVIHETANPGATAKNHRDLWAGTGYYSDYAVHYVLDWTGVCYQCVPEDRLCWQVGNGNKYVVGIELCHATTQSNFNKVWDAGVQWAAWQLKKNGWGIDRLISHNECRVKWGGTDHTDPDGYFESFGKSWSAFKTAVKKALADY